MHRMTACVIAALAGSVFSGVHAAPQITTVPQGKAELVPASGNNWIVRVKQSETNNTDIQVFMTFNGQNEEIGEIRVETLPSSFGASRVRLFVDGAQYAPFPDIDPNFELWNLQSVEGIRRTSGSGELWVMRVRANEIGDVVRNPGTQQNPNPDYGKRFGAIVANHIGTVTANWSIFADIQATGSNWSAPPANDINTVRVDFSYYPQFALDGALLGDVITSGGDIGTIHADGFIGSVNPTNWPQRITTRGPADNVPGGNITTIRAGALGPVTINTGTQSNDGDIGTIETFPGGWGYDEGSAAYLNDPIDFDDTGRPMGFSEGGVLRARTVNSMTLGGGFDSDFEIRNSTTNVYKIGDSMGPNAFFKFNAGNFKNQIAINANNDGGTWDEDARIRVTKNPALWQNPAIPEYYFLGEEYPETPSLLGGGSAGVIGYVLHGEACNPVEGSEIFIGRIDPFSIEIDPPCIYDTYEFRASFYGRLSFASGVSGPDAVEVRKIKRVNGIDYNYGVVTLGSVTIANGRTLVMKRPVDSNSNPVSFEPGFTYVITIKADKVRVAGSDLSNPSDIVYIAQQSYEFTAYDGCQSLFDLNRSGQVTSGDLAEWFIAPSDINGDGVVCGNDAATLQRGINEHGN